MGAAVQTINFLISSEFFGDHESRHLYENTSFATAKFVYTEWSRKFNIPNYDRMERPIFYKFVQDFTFASFSVNKF